MRCNIGGKRSILSVRGGKIYRVGSKAIPWADTCFSRIHMLSYMPREEAIYNNPGKQWCCHGPCYSNGGGERWPKFEYILKTEKICCRIKYRERERERDRDRVRKDSNSKSKVVLDWVGNASGRRSWLSVAQCSVLVLKSNLFLCHYIWIPMIMPMFHELENMKEERKKFGSWDGV